jgi:hypothetical protein
MHLALQISKRKHRSSQKTLRDLGGGLYANTKEIHASQICV